MIKEIKSDIFLSGADALSHFCNCKHVMGGLAGAIKDKWPQVYQADLEFGNRSDPKKMGKVSIAQIQDPNNSIKYVFNLYSQFSYGHDKRHSNYEAIFNSLIEMSYQIDIINKYTFNSIKTVAIAKNAACGLGRADWRIVKVMMDVALENSKFDLVICDNTP